MLERILIMEIISRTHITISKECIASFKYILTLTLNLTLTLTLTMTIMKTVIISQEWPNENNITVEMKI